MEKIGNLCVHEQDGNMNIMLNESNYFSICLDLVYMAYIGSKQFLLPIIYILFVEYFTDCS